MSEFVVSASSAEHPRCADNGGNPRFPCIRASNHGADHRNALGTTWPRAMRRLPWSEDGRDAFVQEGDGLVTQLAEAVEHGTIEVALIDSRYATELLNEPDVSTSELRAAVRILARAVEDVAHVAELRAERLNGPAIGETAARLSAALRGAIGGAR